MPIVDIQVRMRELGRIRTGVSVAVKGREGRTRPEKLETFRLTSPSRELIDAAAAALGGVAQAWGDEWEVITAVDTLEILVPSGESLSQWYELWSAGGCQRRCDGVRNIIADAPCACPVDPAERREQASANPPTACKPTTRLNVMLTALPDLGVWRLESHGYYAATELAGAANLLAYASSAGHPIPARLRLEQREKKQPGKPINRYAVPVIEIIDKRIVDLLPPPPNAQRALASGIARHDLPETPLPADGSGFRAPVDPPGMTQEYFRDLVNQHHFPVARVVEVRERLFPSETVAVIGDAERRAIWTELEKDLDGPE